MVHTYSSHATTHPSQCLMPKLNRKYGNFSLHNIQLRHYVKFYFFWKSRVATNIARINIHVTIFHVGIINICLWDILKTVKIQKLENISIGSIGEEFQWSNVTDFVHFFCVYLSFLHHTLSNHDNPHLYKFFIQRRRENGVDCVCGMNCSRSM